MRFISVVLFFIASIVSAEAHFAKYPTSVFVDSKDPNEAYFGIFHRQSEIQVQLFLCPKNTINCLAASKEYTDALRVNVNLETLKRTLPELAEKYGCTSRDTTVKDWLRTLDRRYDQTEWEADSDYSIFFAGANISIAHLIVAMAAGHRGCGRTTAILTVTSFPGVALMFGSAGSAYMGRREGTRRFNEKLYGKDFAELNTSRVVHTYVPCSIKRLFE